MNENARPFDQEFEATYSELRALAAFYMGQERSNHTLQPTALVNEAYLRLHESVGHPVENRVHFLNMAAQAMRRILVDHARGKNTAKRGGGWIPATLAEIGAVDFAADIAILDLDRALKRLGTLDERGARVVELRVFGGLGMSEIAEIIGVTRRTIQTDWRMASMWLRRELSLPPEA